MNGFSIKKALSLIFAALALQASAQNIVVNGSFESYGATLTGWSSTEGYGWEGVTTTAADGQTFAIISGNLYQDLPTVPGHVYQLRYAVSGNGSSEIRTLLTYWGGTLVATTPFDTTGQTNNNFTWLYVTNTLLATSSTTRLWFGSGEYPNAPGPNLDAVSAIPVDAPPTSCIGAPAGIISWWQGQSNALDSSGGNQGTLLNGVGFTNGLVGEAFYFAGSNQCVQIPYNAALAASNYSIETWVQPLAPISDANTQAVLFAQNNGQCQLLARAGISGVQVVLQFAVDLSNSVSVASSSEFPIGQFSHVAGTWDGTTLRLYINGALDSQTTPGAVPFDSGCPFYIGGIYNTNSGTCSNIGSFFNGVIDEVSYYKRSLSDSEINSVFQAAALGKCGVVHPPSFTLQPTSKTVYAGSLVTFLASATGDAPITYQWQFNGVNVSGATTFALSLTNVQAANAGNYSVVAINVAGSVASSNALLTILPAPSCITVTNGLVSWWKAETNLLDGWDSNDGSLLIRTNSSRLPGGSPYLAVTYALGKVGYAFNISSNGVFVADNDSLRLTNALSIEGWVYPTTLSGLRTIFSKFNPALGSATNSSYYFGANNGSLLFRVNSTGGSIINLSSPQPLQPGQWSHVAATYDGAALRLYQNGLLVAQTNFTAGIFAGTADVGIGAVPFLGTTQFLSSSWSFPWSGYLDEISLYNRALSNDEILGIYNADLTGKCLEPPMIAIQPQSQTVPLNEDALFLPKVLGSKPLRYQWRFNGVNILGASSSRLALEHVQSNSIGNYSFIVTNTLGRATSSVASLTLLPPLSCVSAPTGIVAWWPANNFTNDVIGTNNVRLQLFSIFGSLAYTTGKVAQCFNFTNGYATAGNSAALNIGSNADFSIEGWLKVTPGSSLLSKDPSGPSFYIVQKMSSVTNFLPPFPPPTFAVGYSLLLQNGRLACQLTAPRNTPSNIPTFVSPGPNLGDALFHHVAFTFHRNAPDGGSLYVDGTNVLSFDTRQYGTDSISNSASLLFGDDTINDRGIIGISGGVLASERIDELSIYNRALSPAEVLAVRQAGAAGKCIPPPTIPLQPINQLVQAGSTATLPVIASGFPTLFYQWAKNGLSIPSATNSTLVISNATIADAGQYSVVVSNIGGVTTSASATLTVNRPPIATNLNAATIQNQPINIPIDKLLFYASDPDNDPISLLSVISPTSNGGSFVRGSTDLTYTPPNNYIGFDSSTYTVSDGRGGSASAAINIQIRSADDLSGNLLPLTPIPNGFRISFAGIPGRSYTLQRAETVTGPWSNLTSVVIGPDGLGIFDDTNSPPPTAFYRTLYP